VLLPVSLVELKNKIKSLITSSKFKLDSSIKIKNYILNKNERKLLQLNLSISLTEKEIQLIELLFRENKPLSQNFILQKIWKYSKDADTHTVETHIYRLRKKINNKFKDDNFILNSGNGYFI
jgi:DNA-binding response OmpR family regulator